MTELNTLIVATGEIISTRMARHIVQLALGGCTEQCIPCHFREVWHREIDEESVSAFLERDTVMTNQPVPNGETLLADGRTMVPNGIVSEMVQLARVAESEFIAVYLTLRFPALRCIFTEAMVDAILLGIDELWTTDHDGNPTLDTNQHEPSGHRIGSLPTMPITPRNGGRPRSSHRIPPPIYSPLRPEGHPRQVLVPLALLERQTSPPPYVERDSALSTEELIPPSNDAIVTANEFLANLDYVLQPLDAHPPPSPVRRNSRRTPLGPFNRPGRPTAIRIPPPAAAPPEYHEIAPLDQSPTPSHRTLHPALVPHFLHPQPAQRRRRPPPIISYPNNIPLGPNGVPRENTLRTDSSSVVEDLDIEQRQLRLFRRPSPFEDEFEQPSFFMRSSPFSDHFPSPRSVPIDSETVPLSPEELDDYPLSASPSPVFVDAVLEVVEDERSPDNFANYRERRWEARRSQRETERESSEERLEVDTLSELDYDMFDA